MFNCAVACFAAFQLTKRRKYKRWANYFSKKIHTWCKKGNPNVVHCSSFLKAESMALKKSRFSETVKLYKDSIRQAGRQGVLHDQALAHERLGQFYYQQDFITDSTYHTRMARKFFREWGALDRAAKVSPHLSSITAGGTVAETMASTSIRRSVHFAEDLDGPPLLQVTTDCESTAPSTACGSSGCHRRSSEGTIGS